MNEAFTILHFRRIAIDVFYQNPKNQQSPPQQNRSNMPQILDVNLVATLSCLWFYYHLWKNSIFRDAEETKYSMTKMWNNPVLIAVEPL